MGAKEFFANVKEKQELAKIEKAKWIKITNNFFVSEEYQQIKVNKTVIDFNMLKDAELIEDGKTISKTTGTNKTKGEDKKHISPIKGLIGFGLLGPVGGIIGATSGKTKSNSKTKVNTTTENIDYCTNLSIKISLNSISNPIFMYKLITYKVDKNGFTYRNCYENAQKCISVIQTIINNR